jgi:oligosaccharide repeat unit polymerase
MVLLKEKFYRLLPLFVFLSVWAVTITLYHNLSLNFYEVRTSTWQIIALSLSTVTLGYLIVFFLYKDQDFDESRRIASPIDSKVMYTMIVIVSSISLIGTILYLYTLASNADSITEYLSDPIKARNLVIKFERESISNWNPIIAITNYLAMFNLVGVLFSGYYYIFGKRHKFVALFPLVIAIVYSIITFQRYFFIQIIVTWIFCIMYSLYFQEKKIRIKQALKTFFLVFFSTIVIFIFILSIVLARIDYGTGDVDMIQITGWALKSLATYLVSEMVALDQYFFGQESLLYGLSIFRGFVKWFIRFGIFDDSAGLTVYYEFTKVGKITVNTYTYIRPFYEDFGIYGLLILNFGFGAFGSFSVHNLMMKFSFIKLYIASLLFFAYFLSFFNSIFLNLTMFIYLFMLVYIIEKFMIRKSAQAGNEQM